jgi:hypothetical protein
VKPPLVLCAVVLLAQSIIRSGEPAIVLQAEAHWAGADVLLPLAHAQDVSTARYAIRAVGRLEDPSLLSNLLPLLSRQTVAAAAADAVAQTLEAFDPQRDPATLSSVGERLRALAGAGDVRSAAGVVAPGRIRYAMSEDVSLAEHVLLRILDATKSDPLVLGTRVAAVRSLESLARRNIKLIAFGPDTGRVLRSIVSNTNPNDRPEVRLYALMALIAARALDDGSLQAALDDQDEQVRRVAMAALAGNAAGADGSTRASAISHGLADPSVLVRYESLRAMVRRVVPSDGCAALLDAFRDSSPHVALAAIDAAGDLCRSAHAAGDWLMASRGARVRRARQASPGRGGDVHAGVLLAPRLAGPHVCRAGRSGDRRSPDVADTGL